MNRISHFLRAKTQYNLHSPFVYRLYTEVLFSHCPGRGRSFEDVVWRLEHYYHLPHSHLSPFTSHLSPLTSHLSPFTFHLSPLTSHLSTPDGVILVVDRPHRHEAEWAALVADNAWQVTVDLFSCGLAIASPRLSKQHFLLR